MVYEPNQIGVFIFGVCKNKILSVMVRRVRLGGATAGYWIFCGIFSKIIGSGFA